MIRVAAYNSVRAYFIDFPPPRGATDGEDVRAKQVAAIREGYGKRR